MIFRRSPKPCGSKISRSFSERFLEVYTPETLIAYWKGELGKAETDEVYEALKQSPELQDQLSRAVEKLSDDDPGKDSHQVDTLGSGQSR